MLNNIIGFSIRNKAMIAIFTLGLIVWGSFSIMRLPIDAVPDITNNQVQVITYAPSQSALDIERLVTFPIEQSFATIPNIEEVRSFSRFGLSMVTIVFKEHVDIYWARQQISERMSQVKDLIPKGIGAPELAPVTTGLGEIYQYVLYAKKGYEKKFDPTKLRTIQDWIVRRQLLGTEGVADVSSFGGNLKQYEVALDPYKLNSMKISMAEVFSALEKNNQNTGGAYIEKNSNAYFISVDGLISSTEEIENVPVKISSGGFPVLIKDIGQVKIGRAIRYGAMTHNTEGEVVGAIVFMLKGANSGKVIKNVKERIALIKKNLPEGIELEPYLDRTKLVNSAIGTVAKNLAEGALIVIFILVLFLGNFRAGLIVASVIPLAMLFAISLMNVFGVSGNLMSLGAIDFGLIVDGAVIIVEATMHHLIGKNVSRKLTQQEMNDEVFNSASKIRSSAAFGEIIILIVYLPILALSGIEGKMFKPMAQTVSFAILGAFILSLTYIPMMSAMFLSKKISGKKNISEKFMDFLQKLYSPVIKTALKIPWAITLASVGIFIASIFLFRTLGAEFLPKLDEGDFAVETRILKGSSLNETVKTATNLARILLEKFPDEVKNVVGKIGSAEIPVDPMPIESCDLIIVLHEKSKWKKASTTDELADKMSKELEALPGVTLSFQQPIQMRFNELMTGAKGDVVVKIYGENLNKLSSYAKKMGKIISGIKGASDLYVEEISGLPQIKIKHRYDMKGKFGIDGEQINDAVNMAFAGRSAGFVYEDEKRFDLVVRLDQSNRKTIEDIKTLFVTSASGKQIPLDQLADIKLIEGPSQVQRDDAKRRIVVSFNVRGRDVESIINELKSKTEKQIKFEPGYFPVYGGAFKNLEEARSRLSIAVPIALFLILVLLFFTFNSLRDALMIFSAIPLSAIGGILALWFRGMPFSISAGVGFIALFGVAVLNGIVLIGEFNLLKKNGLSDIKEIIYKGTNARLRAVIMTASVASLGFLPMALSNGAGAEVQKPLATVVIGGLLSATLLTLIVLPCIYSISDKIIPKAFGSIKAPKITVKTITLLCCFGVFISPAQTGQTLSMNAAVEAALKNNFNVKSAASETEYLAQLKNTSTSLPKTDFNFMYGQYNSFFKQDNNLSVAQTIPFPTLLVARSEMYAAMKTGSEMKTAFTKNEIVFRVKQTYVHLLYLYQYKNELQKLDSIFGGVENLANTRYKAGESTLLEKTSAATKKQEAYNHIKNIENEIEIYLCQLQTFTGIQNKIEIEKQKLTAKDFSAGADTNSVKSNPRLNYFRQQIEIARKQKSVTSNSALPDIKLGYFNQTLYGVPLDNSNQVFATNKNRFTGFQVGLGIPLWFLPEIAKAKAEQKNIEIAKYNYLAEEQNMKNSFLQVLQEYMRAQNSLAYFNTSALPNAELIDKQSSITYTKGEISLSEHLLNLNLAAQVREGYLKTLHDLNQSVIYLEYLLSK